MGGKGKNKKVIEVNVLDYARTDKPL